MTQKELLYLEDAIGHEDTIIEVCIDAIDCLSEKNLVKFMEKELKKHLTFREKLLSFLEEKANE